jgi:hypothetical protein
MDITARIAGVISEGLGGDPHGTAMNVVKELGLTPEWSMETVVLSPPDFDQLNGPDRARARFAPGFHEETYDVISWRTQGIRVGLHDVEHGFPPIGGAIPAPGGGVISNNPDGPAVLDE